MELRINFMITLRNYKDKVQKYDTPLISPKLRKILSIILQIGNFVNGGTPKRGAHGFSLDTFSRLRTYKTNKGDSCVNFIAQQLEQDQADFVEDFKELINNSSFNVDALSQTLNEMNKNILEC